MKSNTAEIMNGCHCEGCSCAVDHSQNHEAMKKINHEEHDVVKSLGVSFIETGEYMDKLLKIAQTTPGSASYTVEKIEEMIKKADAKEIRKFSFCVAHLAHSYGGLKIF